MKQARVRECVLGQGGTAPAVANRSKLHKIAAQHELCAKVREPVERRQQLDIKLSYFVDPEAVHAAGAVDYMPSHPSVGCAPARARSGAMGLRANIDFLPLGAQELNKSLAAESFPSAWAPKHQ
jgi:hypothetical protein